MVDSPIGGGGPIGADGPIGAGPPDEAAIAQGWMGAGPRAPRPLGVLALAASGLIWAPQIIVVPSNTVTIDKWQQPLSAPRRTASAARYSSGSLFVSPAGLAGVTLDQWQAPFSRTFAARPAPLEGGTRFVPVGERIEPVRLGPGFVTYAPQAPTSHDKKRREWRKKDRERLRKAITLALEGDPGPLARLTGLLIARDGRARTPEELLRLLQDGMPRAEMPQELDLEQLAQQIERALIAAENDEAEAILFAVS